MNSRKGVHYGKGTGGTGPRADLDRRGFMKASTAAAVVVGFAPLISKVELAFGAESVTFAWLSDTHLYPKSLNTRFVDKVVRAVDNINAMDPAPEFLIFGGDLAQLGDPVELELGKELLSKLKVKNKYFIPGEHDWYLDMGKAWEKMFSASPWSFDYKGIRFVGLNTVGQAPDYWSATKMTPQERMGHMATLDGSVAGPWAGLGRDQLRWLDSKLADWPKNKPVIIFTHNPLYEYYPPWNFWVRDWREVHEIIRPFSKVTNIHGHTHQVLYNEIGSTRSIGMLATSWPWPYAPEGVPELTVPMLRADPGDHFDGVGWGKLAMQADKVDYTYMMWREPKNVFSEKSVDSGTGDNVNQRLSPRMADKMWPYEVNR